MPVCSEDEDHVRAVALTKASETSMCKVTSMNSLRGMTLKLEQRSRLGTTASSIWSTRTPMSSASSPP